MYRFSSTESSVGVPLHEGKYEVLSAQFQDHVPLFQAQQVLSGKEDVWIPECDTLEEFVYEINKRSRHLHLSLRDRVIHADNSHGAPPAGFYDDRRVVYDGGWKLKYDSPLSAVELLFEPGSLVSFSEPEQLASDTHTVSTLFGKASRQLTSDCTIPKYRQTPAAPLFRRSNDSYHLDYNGRVMFDTDRLVLSLVGRNAQIPLRSPFFGIAPEAEFLDPHQTRFSGFALHGFIATNARHTTTLAVVPTDSKALVLVRTVTGFDAQFIKHDGTAVTCFSVVGTGNLMISDHQQQCVDFEPPKLLGALATRVGCISVAIRCPDGQTIIESELAVVATSTNYFLDGTDSAIPWVDADVIITLIRDSAGVTLSVGAESFTLAVPTDTHAGATIIKSGCNLGCFASGSTDCRGVVHELSNQNAGIDLGVYHPTTGFANAELHTDEIIVSDVSYTQNELIAMNDLSLVFPDLLYGDSRALPKVRAVGDAVVSYRGDVVWNGRGEPFFLARQKKLYCQYYDTIKQQLVPANDWFILLAPRE